MQQNIGQHELEKAILDEIASIDHKCADLTKDRMQLERMLFRIRREGLSHIDVTRKNSLGRVLIENAIIERIKLANGKAVDARELNLAAKLKNPRLKDVTFRSYLYRMKEKGIIARAKTNASKWLVVDGS